MHYSVVALMASSSGERTPQNGNCSNRNSSNENNGYKSINNSNKNRSSSKINLIERSKKKFNGINHSNNNPYDKLIVQDRLREAEEVRLFPDLIMTIPIASPEKISKKELFRNSFRAKREIILKAQESKYFQSHDSGQSSSLPSLNSTYCSTYGSTYIDTKKGGNLRFF